ISRCTRRRWRRCPPDAARTPAPRRAPDELRFHRALPDADRRPGRHHGVSIFLTRRSSGPNRDRPLASAAVPWHCSSEPRGARRGGYPMRRLTTATLALVLATVLQTRSAGAAHSQAGEAGL